MKLDYLKIIDKLRQRIETSFYESESDISSGYFHDIDGYIKDDRHSPLEKAIYLMLNQFPSDHKNYIVRPNEKVIMENLYDFSEPFFEYEIDFAIYAGTIKDHIKIAIECDGIRSHANKFSNKERRKNVNLEAKGWIIMRYGSKEIHDELDKFDKDDLYIPELTSNIDNLIERRLSAITHFSFIGEHSHILTGYKYDNVECPKCGFTQLIKINKINVQCRKCDTTFKQERYLDKNIRSIKDSTILFN